MYFPCIFYDIIFRFDQERKQMPMLFGYSSQLVRCYFVCMRQTSTNFKKLYVITTANFSCCYQCTVWFVYRFYVLFIHMLITVIDIKCTFSYKLSLITHCHLLQSTSQQGPSTQEFPSISAGVRRWMSDRPYEVRKCGHRDIAKHAINGHTNF